MSSITEDDWIAARDDFLYTWRLCVPQDPIVVDKGGNQAYIPDQFVQRLGTYDYDVSYRFDLGPGLDQCRSYAFIPDHQPSYPYTDCDFQRDIEAMIRVKLCLHGLLDLYPHLNTSLRPAMDRLIAVHGEFWPGAKVYYTYDPKFGPSSEQAAG